MNCCPELGLYNAPKTKFLFPPARELFGSTNKTINIIKNEIKNQTLSIRLILIMVNSKFSPLEF